jgi:hypothetical protein
VSTSNSHHGPGAGDVVAAVRPVMLLRYRPGVVGETARTVHVVPLPPDGQAGVVGALCGAVLMLPDMETVIPGAGMPCTDCVLTLGRSTPAIGEPPAGSSAEGAGLAAGGLAYHGWGWPVTVHGDQIGLSLCREVSAWAMPVPLCTDVTRILTDRGCAPPVLAHPDTPEHRIILTGERYGVRLPWPHDVHQVTGVLLLPPTVTPHGPITWTQPPQEDSLRGCREIDLFGALRTARRDSHPVIHHLAVIHTPES